MEIKSFSDLFVWQKAHQLVLQIYQLSHSFPYQERFGFTSQLRRATVSVCANIAEGYMKTRKDFVRFLDISRGSLEETKYYLILGKDLNYITDEQYKKLFGISEEVGKMLYKLSQSLR